MQNLEVEEGYWEKYVVGGPKDPVAFGKLLAPYMIRRTKEEVMPELPEKLAFEIRTPLTEPQKELYDEIRKQKDILVQAGGRELFIPNALALLTRLQQISSWPPLLDFDWSLGSGKLQWLDTFLEDHPDDKLVVFTRFRELAKFLANKYDAGIVIGGQREIPKNPARVIGTIDAMGEGLNFQWAKHAIFVDSHWSTIKMTQAVDRVHRMDIKEPKNLYFLWSTREDRLVLDAMDKKMSESELVYYFLKEADND
jgi:non-specific serine/threonine protein kinase